MDYEIFVTPGLGDNSYLVASEGEAVIVDPQRDAWRFLAVADTKRWRLRYVLETHVHNDYLSGALEVYHSREPKSERRPRGSTHSRTSRWPKAM